MFAYYLDSVKSLECFLDIVIISQKFHYRGDDLEVRAIIVTKIEDDRGVPAEELLKLFRKYTKTETLCCPRLADALLEARRLQKDGGSAGDIYCLGSLYLAGMVKKLLSGGGLDVEF